MNLRKKKGTLAMITRLSKFLKMMKSPLYKKKKAPHTHTHTHIYITLKSSTNIFINYHLKLLLFFG